MSSRTPSPRGARRSRSRSPDARKSSRRRTRSRSRSYTRSPSPQRNRLHIANIDETVRRKDIEEAYGKFGKLEDIWVASYPPFYAFVVYEREKDAEEALREMRSGSIRDCRVRTSIALPRQQGGGGRHFGGRRRSRSPGGYYGRRSRSRSRSRSPRRSRRSPSPPRRRRRSSSGSR